MRHSVRTLVVAFALFALLAPAAFAGDLPETFAEAKALAAKENKPLLVNFFTTW